MGSSVAGGAWTAGAFAVLIALGGSGTDAAAGMIVVQLLANSVLQQLVQPFAMGAALGIHPLALLIVTTAGRALFGAAGERRWPSGRSQRVGERLLRRLATDTGVRVAPVPAVHDLGEVWD